LSLQLSNLLAKAVLSERLAKTGHNLSLRFTLAASLYEICIIAQVDYLVACAIDMTGFCDCCSYSSWKSMFLVHVLTRQRHSVPREGVAIN